MPARPANLATLSIAALAIFTVWITWRAKTLEISSGQRQSSPSIIGKPAPDFQLASLDGRLVSLAEFRGKKKVAIIFWASWCGPCRLEMPELRRFYRSTHQNDANFEFLAISIDDQRGPAQVAAREDKLPFPVLMDSASRTADSYGVDAIPTLLLIDEQGKVEWGNTGYQAATIFMLATELGIKNYTPQPEEQTDVASH